MELFLEANQRFLEIRTDVWLRAKGASGLIGKLFGLFSIAKRQRAQAGNRAQSCEPRLVGTADGTLRTKRPRQIGEASLVVV